MMGLINRIEKKQRQISRTRRVITTIASAQDNSLQPDSVLSNIDWKPNPGPQDDALNSKADELLYGGSAGGGKTDLLLGCSLTQHHSSIIFRRELAQMKGPEGIISRSEEIIGDAGKLNRSDYVWKGLPGGASLEFGGVPHEHSKNKHKGRPHDFIGFDELTEFSHSMYRFLIIWNRSSKPDQRCRVVNTTNPPTTDEETWVIDAWAPWLDEDYPDPALPGELRWYTYDGDEIVWFKEDEIARSGDEVTVEYSGKTRHLRSRTFIPARLEDNPYLMNSGYGAVLDSLPEELKVYQTGLFSRGLAANPFQVIPTEWVRQAQDRWKKLKAEGFVPSVPLTALGVDPSRGGKDSTVIVPRYGDYVPEIHEYPGKGVPDGQAAAVLMLRHYDQPANVIIDVIGYGSSAYDFAKTMMPCYPFNASEGSKAKDKSGKFGFVNKRAAAYWRLRELLEPGGKYEIALPDDSKLRQELTSTRFSVLKNGIKIESKDEIKKRIGRSPDKADGVVYAFYQPVIRRRRVIQI